MNEALDIARSALATGDVPVGAIVINKDGVVVGKGFNEREANNDPTAHAEILAIRKACSILKQKRLDGYAMIVNVAPCLLCLEAIKSARIREVHYLFSNHNPERKTIKLPKLIQHNSEEENLLKIFFREKRLNS